MWPFKKKESPKEEIKEEKNAFQEYEEFILNGLVKIKHTENEMSLNTTEKLTKLLDESDSFLEFVRVLEAFVSGLKIEVLYNLRGADYNGPVSDSKQAAGILNLFKATLQLVIENLKKDKELKKLVDNVVATVKED